MFHFSPPLFLTLTLLLVPAFAHPFPYPRARQGEPKIPLPSPSRHELRSSLQPFSAHAPLVSPELPPIAEPGNCPVRLSPHAPSRQVTPRIVGGDTSPKSIASYLVAIHSASGFSCSGTLLSSRWVLTASHCLFSPLDTTAFLATITSDSGFSIPVDAVFNPSPYANLSYPGEFPNDVSLLRLASDAPKNASFALVNSDPSIPVSKSFARAAGYGITRLRGFNKGGLLRQVDISIVDWDLCKSLFLDSLTPERLCAGSTTGRCSPCNGDSGGPLFQFDNAGNPVLIGTVNAGVACGLFNYPAMFMRVSSYVGWMQSIGAEFTTSSGAKQELDTSSPLPFEQSPVPQGRPEPRPSPTVCPVVLPQLPANKTLVRVVGGNLASDSTARFVASFHDFFGFQCTGIVISEQWVLTTANCILRGNYSVKIGGSDIHSGFNTSIDEVFLPNGFRDPSVHVSENGKDFAAVRLKDSISFPEFVILNDDKSVPKAGSFAKVVGYGDVQEKVRSSDGRLRQVDIPVKSEKQCPERFSAIADEIICAGYQKGDCDACFGDGGGPLLQFDAEDRPVALGIIWAGKGCARAGSIGVHLRVSSVVSWLDSIGATFRRSSDNGTDPIPPHGNSSCPVVLGRERAESEESAPRIVGGFNSRAVPKRYMVALQSNDTNSCSGVLLSEEWALTAATCSVIPGWTVESGNQALQLSVSGIVTEVFSGKDTEPPNKLALVQFKAEVPPSVFLGIKFPKVNTLESAPELGAYVRIEGYGISNPSNNTSGFVREVNLLDIPVQSGRVCKEYITSNDYNEENKICAGYTDKSCSTCYGDAGGPLLQYEEDGSPVLVGVTIRDDNCGTEVGVQYFERSSSALSWMRNVDASFQVSDAAQQHHEIDRVGTRQVWLISVLVPISIFSLTVILLSTVWCCCCKKSDKT